MATKTKVRLIFSKSDRGDGKLISFVTNHNKVGGLQFIHASGKVHKSIVLPTPELAPGLVGGIEYDCEIVPMKNGARGYVAVNAAEAPTTQYPTSMVATYVKKAIYQITIKWSDNKIVFSPFRSNSVYISKSAIAKTKSDLLRRRDIFERDIVADAFEKEAKKLFHYMNQDGILIVN